MNPFIRTCTAIAAASVLLVACGGGNDDDPTPSNEPGVLTVTSAAGGLNGVYGNGALNLTDVDKKNPIGSVPELCSFNFDGANKVGASSTGFGDLRYRPGEPVLYQAFMTFAGKEYSSDDGTDTAVDRDKNLVRFTSKTLTATDGPKATLKVTGIVPMRTGRPSGC